ncbi:22736_t:CDS:2, partial [Gigaspora rosea]
EIIGVVLLVDSLSALFGVDDGIIGGKITTFSGILAFSFLGALLCRWCGSVFGVAISQ